MRALAERFFELFSGLDRAYGTYQVEVTKTSGKQVGAAKTLTGKVDAKLWERHLTGKDGIGIIPINDNNETKFGAIDIDVYRGLDISQIVRKLVKLQLPLVPTRSKSGGCHLWLFVSEWVPASQMQEKLREMATLMEYGKAEVFPKQAQILSERGDIGNWINMPYFNGVNGLRYGVKEDGSAQQIEEFLTYAESRRLTKEQFEQFKSAPSEELKDGPPCLQYILGQGPLGEGLRNDGLFNVAVYLSKKFGPDADITGELISFNQTHCNPRLGASEVKILAKSVGAKGYNYTCGKAPFDQYCNKDLCKIRPYGMSSGNGFPVLSSLTKFNTDPPLWFMDVDNGGRMELTTEDLQNMVRFQRRCMDALNLMPPLLNRIQWQTLVNGLMANMTIIEVSHDASPRGQLLEYLERFCTSRAQAHSKEELLLGKPWLHEGKHYFRLSDFMQYLDRQHFKEFKIHKITSILKEQLKGESQFFKIKGKGINVWSIQSFDYQSEAHDTPTFETEIPY
jgi:hypothetical protein